MLQGDRLFYTIEASSKGTAELSPDGQSVSFAPADGYVGTGAGFTVVADDGYSSSSPATVEVTVSNAELTYLEWVERTPQLQVGERVTLAAVGRFADSEAEVSLPASYLSWTSDDPTVIELSERGTATAVGDGTVLLTASRSGTDVEAVTVAQVGSPLSSLDADSTAEDFDIALAGLVGFDLYPDAGRC